MLDHLFSGWIWCASNRPGFCSGTFLISIFILSTWLSGIHASLSLGPGGEFPGFYEEILDRPPWERPLKKDLLSQAQGTVWHPQPELRSLHVWLLNGAQWTSQNWLDLIFYALSHEELTSFLYNIILLLWLGPCQERRWGTFVFLALSFLSTVLLPPIYALFLFVTGDEASRVSGYSATHLALFTAQCRQVKQRRVLRHVPVWFLPWFFLLLNLFLLPSAPGLLHFYAICLGLNYNKEFIDILQQFERRGGCACLTKWAYIPVTSHPHLPTYVSSLERPESCVEPSRMGHLPSVSRSQLEDHSHVLPWQHSVSEWHEESSLARDVHLLEEQMLKAGILASLQDAPEGADKVEVPKSSVSSLRLQQLEKMGFPTEKAVVALAATGQLDGAISLLIDDQIGEEAVVISKGKKSPSS